MTKCESKEEILNLDGVGLSSPPPHSLTVVGATQFSIRLTPELFLWVGIPESEAVHFHILSSLKNACNLRTLHSFVVSYIQICIGASRFNFHIFSIIPIRTNIHGNSMSVSLSDP
jgi:hypothetical protein